MNYLLDSHVFIWALLAPDKLSKHVRKVLEDSGSGIFVSAITFWELSLKFSLGKLQLNGVSPDELPALAVQTGFELLSLNPAEASSYHKLDASWHRDPFDRMLICQAVANNLILISKDDYVARYESIGLKVLW